jgi:SpoVK/Ycf46/Vps4 family AAA+-type ATPase
LIFLLYGPPGLGKTLTAESVAEVAKRPLYHISAGELSTDVRSLETELRKIFQMGARWNAVVLLDEADVLMSKRTARDLRRNSVVAGKASKFHD